MGFNLGFKGLIYGLSKATVVKAQLSTKHVSTSSSVCISSAIPCT